MERDKNEDDEEESKTNFKPSEMFHENSIEIKFYNENSKLIENEKNKL